MSSTYDSRCVPTKVQSAPALPAPEGTGRTAHRMESALRLITIIAAVYHPALSNTMRTNSLQTKHWSSVPLLNILFIYFPLMYSTLYVSSKNSHVENEQLIMLIFLFLPFSLSPLASLLCRTVSSAACTGAGTQAYTHTRTKPARHYKTSNKNITTR